MDEQAVRNELCRVGRDLFWMGLQSPLSGNLSAMLEDRGSFLITRTGASLRKLDVLSDLIEVRIDRASPQAASSEVAVHRAIYEATSHRAIVHAHPPHAIALSFTCQIIRPIHNEARVALGDIPVTISSGQEGQGEDPEPIVAALRNHYAMVVQEHGAFTVGKDPESAFYHMGLLEAACKIIYLARQLRPQ